MKIEIHSHNQGEQTVDPKIRKDLQAMLSGLKFSIVKGCAEALRHEILTRLTVLGWSEEFVLNADSKISLTSSYHNHVLCLQTGNMGRFYADLLKMQYVYMNKTVKAAFYILPSKLASKAMGDNIAHFDRMKRELDFFQHIITIPTLVFGIN
jgi:hypothetical protein